MSVDSGPFPQSALDANKNGSLTKSQRQFIRSLSRGLHKSELSFAALAVAFAIVIFVGVRSSTPALERVGIPVACLALAAFLLLRAMSGADKLTRDLRHPRVETLEGPISKRVVNTGSSGPVGTVHYLNVAGQRFEVGNRAYEAAPEAGFVRIYFLPMSRHVVNLEQLPDRLLPEDTEVHALAQELKGAVRSHDLGRIDELRAEMAGTEHAMMAGFSQDGVAPPPEDSQDPRPLAEAIQGTWSNGPVKVVFAEDGSFSVTILGANQQSGHWSINGDGKLVADFAGREQSTAAWIAGDQLTVSLGGSTMTLNRASS